MATVRASSPADEVTVLQKSAEQVAVADQEPGLPDSPSPAADLPAPAYHPTNQDLSAGTPDVAAKPKITPAMIDKRFEQLLQQVQAKRANEDVTLIRKAWDFCVQHHAGQVRASGEPYIIHPLEVAEVLAEMKLDATAIASGLLHDSVEDTPATNEEISANFGDQVAHIVDGVTKIDKIQLPIAKTARPRMCARCCWPW
jgi:hypothetical protein